VRGTQFFEVYGADGSMRDKSFMNTCFYLHEKEAFHELVRSEGFAVLVLYGDYSRGAFEEDGSPFMIWVLGRDGRQIGRGERSG
jgi:hypothetical protein